MARLLLFGNYLCNRNKDFDGEQSNTVLIVTGQVLKQGNHLIDDDRYWNFLDKLCKVVGGLSSDHRCLIMNEVTKLGSEALLGSLRGFLVGSNV